MTYTAAAGVALVVAVVIDVALRTRLLRSATWWAAYGLVLLFQLVTNGWLTGRGIVRYADRAILGDGRIVFLGHGRLAFAPVEDVAFGFALVLMTCSAWVAAGRRARHAPRDPDAALPSPPPPAPR